MRSTLYLALFAILTGCTTQPPEGADAAAPTVHAPDAFTAPGHADVLREPDHEDHVIECAPDDAEPDGDAASATDVLDSTDLRDRTLCGAADTDWYRLPDVAASDLLELRAVALVDGADLDLRLYGPDGELLLEGRNAGRIETLLWSVEEAGDHYVEAVLVGDDDDGTDYDLSVTRELRPSECDPDPFEPNDGMDDARAMTAAWYEGFTLCPSDDDWYAIDAAAGEEIEILVDFFDTEGDVFAALFDPNGEEIAVGDSSDDDEHLVAVAPETGRYLLHVGLSEDRGGIPGNRYGLLVGGIAQTCVSDLFEPNDDPSAAVPMPNGDHRDQTICPGDDDWYALSLEALQELEINIGYLADEGDVDVFLHGPDGEIVVAGTSSDNDERVVWTVPESGTYLMQVTLAEDAGSPGNVYDFGVLALVTSECSADFYEPNESPAGAASLEGGEYDGLTTCLGEPDFFEIQVGMQAEFVDLVVDADPGEGELEILLWDADGELVGEGPSILVEAPGVFTSYLLEIHLVEDPGEPGVDYDFVVLL